MSLRRYYLGMEYTARLQGDPGSASAARGLRLEVPATPLPEAFPCLLALREAGYLAREDLIGADADELRRVAGISPSQARVVLAALESLA
jgi:hypothetical protein